MKAVVLAAGEGRRLEPLTNVRPKPMLPVANRPILEHVVEAAAEAGIEEIVLVVGYKRRRIQDHFGDGDDWGVEITYVVQEQQLGSGHALLQAERAVGSDVVVLNGDEIIDSTVIESVVEERQRSGDAVMAATRSAETELYGVVTVEDGRAADIAEKPRTGDIDSELINAGVYAFGPEIFAALRDTEHIGELALTATLQQHLDDHPVRVVPYEGSWMTVNRPWDLLTVNGHLLDRADPDTASSASVHETACVVDDAGLAENVSVAPNATVLRGTSLGRNVSVGANAVLDNAVVMADASIGPGSVLRDCVVGGNVEVGPGTTVEGGTTDVVLDDEIHRGVRFGGVLGDNARLGGAVTVRSGTLLGNDSEVQGGTVLEGQFEPESRVRGG